MYASEFEYKKASSVAEAIQLLTSNPDSKILAGGHSLLPMMKLRLARPAMLIDIGGIAELRGIGVEGGTLSIGALATHYDISSSSVVQNALPMLAEAAEGIGDTQVRNRGTIGGNVAHSDPASDWPAVLTASDAQFVIQGPGGRRTASTADFFTGLLSTSLADDEILTGIEVPVLQHDQRAEYAKMAHPASGFAVVGAAVVLTLDHHKFTAARIAVGGLVPVPARAPTVEAALVGQEATMDNIAAATSKVSEDLGDDVFGDFYASAEYRRAMAAVEMKHAIFHATDQAHH